MALATSVPLAVIGAALDRALELDTSADDVGRLALFASIVLADIAFVVLGSTFLSGILDQYLQELGDEREDPSGRAILRAVAASTRRVHLARLLIADVLVTAITIVGLLLFIVPGLVAALLLWLTGPIISMEGRRPISAMRRSAHLSLRGPVAVGVALVLPAAIWGIGSAVLDETPFGNVTVLVLGGLIYAPFAALARIVAAQQLIERDQMVRR